MFFTVLDYYSSCRVLCFRLTSMALRRMMSHEAGDEHDIPAVFFDSKLLDRSESAENIPFLHGVGSRHHSHTRRRQREHRGYTHTQTHTHAHTHTRTHARTHTFIDTHIH